MKTCTNCKQEKPFTGFYASSTHKSGYVSWCKECEAKRCKAKDRYANYFFEYAKANRGKVNAKWMKREAAKKSRTPAWLSDDEHWMIEQAYDIAAIRTKMLGISFHVDHIIPLHGKTVSGLHVPWNLQVISAKENQIKSNKLTALEGA